MPTREGSTRSRVFAVASMLALFGAIEGGAQLSSEVEERLELRFLRPPMQFASPPATPTRAPFSINLVVSGLTTGQQAIFDSAKRAWESRISGYQPGINLGSVTIEATGEYIDGEGGYLGFAGPTDYTEQGGFVLATQGVMRFDWDDLERLQADGSLREVIEHEMGHVLGIGTLWQRNDVYASGSHQYDGAAGVAAWRANFSGQGDADWVPVEDDGGRATAEGHWNENEGGSGPVGITENGQDMQHELMTGWLDSPTFYSSLTHDHLQDLGFTVFPFDRQLFNDDFESGDTVKWSTSGE